MSSKVIGGFAGAGGLIGCPPTVIVVHEAIPDPPWMGLAAGALVAAASIVLSIVFASYEYKRARIPYDVENLMARTDSRRARDEARRSRMLLKRVAPGRFGNQKAASRIRADLMDAVIPALTPNEATPTTTAEVMRIGRGQRMEPAEETTPEQGSDSLAVVKKLPPAIPSS